MKIRGYNKDFMNHFLAKCDANFSTLSEEEKKEIQRDYNLGKNSTFYEIISMSLDSTMRNFNLEKGDIDEMDINFYESLALNKLIPDSYSFN